MSKGICFLYGAGEYDYSLPVFPQNNDYVIAVDGGYDYIKQIGITPNLLIGDFDSTEFADKLPDDITVMHFPPHKDYTDMHLAVLEGIHEEYEDYVIYGGTGGRMDHTLANIQLLAWMSAQKLHGYLIGNKQIITSITDSSFDIKYSHSDKASGCLSLFAGQAGKYISVFSHSDVSEGVTITGLEYCINNTTLTCNYALGTSNSFTGNDYSISVAKGTLIIVSEL